jgi:hypothetical protein
VSGRLERPEALRVALDVQRVAYELGLTVEALRDLVALLVRLLEDEDYLKGAS